MAVEITYPDLFAIYPGKILTDGQWSANQDFSSPTSVSKSILQRGRGKREADQESNRGEEVWTLIVPAGTNLPLTDCWWRTGSVEYVVTGKVGDTPMCEKYTLTRADVPVVRELVADRDGLSGSL